MNERTMRVILAATFLLNSVVNSQENLPFGLNDIQDINMAPVPPVPAALMGCGAREFRESRVVGGKVAQKFDYPWQASIKYRTLQGKLMHICGASIINPYWLISAAHCFTKQDHLERYVFRVGDHNLQEADEFEQERNATAVIIHTQYDKEAYHNDIALIKLSSPFDLTNLQAICLPSPEMVFTPDTYCTISGWGHQKWKSEISSVLMEVRLPIWEQNDCREAYKLVNNITDNMLCAGLKEGGAGSCTGDSGGPYQCTVDGKTWYLAGIVSHSIECALPKYPSVMTRVSAYIPFIEKMMFKYNDLV